MTPSFLDPVEHSRLLTRLNTLTPDTQRLWGSMTASQMIVHCTDQVRVTIGEKPITTRLQGWLKPIVKWVMIDLMDRFPKNMGTLNELHPGKEMTRPTEFEADRRTLLALLDPTRYPEGSTFDHPAFGRLKRDDFGRAVWKHLDHHLRQFGV